VLRPRPTSRLLDTLKPASFPQVQHLLDDLRSSAIGGIFRSCLAIFEACQAMLPIGGPPTIETGPTDAKITASLADIANLVSVLEHPQLVVHIPPEFVHRNHPSCPCGSG